METPTLKCPRSGRVLTPLSMDYWRLKKKLDRVMIDLSDSEIENNAGDQTPLKTSKTKSVKKTEKTPTRLPSISSEDELPALDSRCTRTNRIKPRRSSLEAKQCQKTLENLANHGGNENDEEEDEAPVFKPRARRRAQKFRIQSSSSDSDEKENQDSGSSNEANNLSKAFAAAKISSETPAEQKTPQRTVIQISSDDDCLISLDERIKTEAKTPVTGKTTTEKTTKTFATEPKKRVVNETDRGLMPPPTVSVRKVKNTKPVNRAEDEVEIDDLLENLRSQKHEDDDYDESQVDLDNSVCEWETSNQDDRDFLKSLDEDSVPLNRCHKDALKFRKSKFSAIRDDLVKKLFDLYHRTVFQNRFESEIPITWNVRMAKTAGFCYYRRHVGNLKSARIELSPKVVDRTLRLRDTLLHELCHAAAWLIHGYRDGHGTLFKFWGQRAYQLLGLTVTTTHTYQIETKYIYRCNGCANEVRRHSKSLDTSRFICSLCKGRFELFLNDKHRKQVTPVADRKPSPFSNFVRDEYKTVKANSPHFSHQEVMTALSERWKSKKNGK